MVRKSCPPFVLAHVEDVKGSGGRRLRGGGDGTTGGRRWTHAGAGGKGANFYEECPLLGPPPLSLFLSLSLSHTLSERV